MSVCECSCVYVSVSECVNSSNKLREFKRSSKKLMRYTGVRL